jgi:hypothetical protein
MAQVGCGSLGPRFRFQRRGRDVAARFALDLTVVLALAFDTSERLSLTIKVRSRIEQTEGAKFRLKVMNELKVRGVNDILIAVVDGLKDFPEAITTVFAQTLVRTYIVHLIRNSLAFVTWKDRKAIMPSIRAI